MNTPSTFFKRYELKYLLGPDQFRRLGEAMQGRLQPDPYGPATICSLYYDTPDRLLIRRSLEKPVYKEKLRLRSYGPPAPESTVFVELKKKYKGVVYKRRVAMPLGAAQSALAGRRPLPGQVGREIGWALTLYPAIAPAMAIAYDRTAWLGTDDHGLRITFDSHILWQDHPPTLGPCAGGNPLLAPGQRLMEVKFPDAMPLWLAHELDRLAIYPTSFSKYGGAYRAALQGKGAVSCA